MEYFDSLGVESKLPCSIILGLIDKAGEKYDVDCTSRGLVIK